MSIIIQNISPTCTPETGPQEYLVRINERVMAYFMHDRQAGGLVQCLRDAADAVEKMDAKQDPADFLEELASNLENAVEIKFGL